MGYAIRHLHARKIEPAVVEILSEPKGALDAARDLVESGNLHVEGIAPDLTLKSVTTLAFTAAAVKCRGNFE